MHRVITVEIKYCLMAPRDPNSFDRLSCIKGSTGLTLEIMNSSEIMDTNRCIVARHSLLFEQPPIHARRFIAVVNLIANGTVVLFPVNRNHSLCSEEMSLKYFITFVFIVSEHLYLCSGI